MLPVHCHAQLGHARDLFREGHVAVKEHPEPSCTGGLQKVRNARRNLWTISNLGNDADLHVVYKQGHARWIANLLQRSRNIQPEFLLHVIDSSITQMKHRAAAATDV